MVHVNGGGEVGEEEPVRVKRARLEQNYLTQTLHDGSEIGMLVLKWKYCMCNTHNKVE